MMITNRCGRRYHFCVRLETLQPDSRSDGVPLAESYNPLQQPKMPVKRIAIVLSEWLLCARRFTLRDRTRRGMSR
jgi:hypothetical protein